MASVADKVKQIIVEQLGVEESEVTPTASFVDDLGADSLEIVEVVSRSMKELKIRVPRTELATAKNLSQLVDLFERAASQRPAEGQVPAG